MKQTIDIYRFREAFQQMGRGKQFSYEAIGMIYEHYDEFPEMELDIIAICCEWSEYDWNELVNCYDHLSTMTKSEGLEWMQDNTVIFEVKDKDYISGITSTTYLVHAF